MACTGKAVGASGMPDVAAASGDGIVVVLGMEHIVVVSDMKHSVGDSTPQASYSAGSSGS